MQSSYETTFHREQGFAQADWVRCLPGAVRGAAIDLNTPGLATVAVGGGWLTLRWQELPPRAIGLIRFARLSVDYRFDGVADEDRHAFMKYFDLYTQRGGG